MSEITNAFFRGDYMPHGHCFLWQPGILWVNVLSDAAIALAYFSIPCALAIFVKKRKDMQAHSVFILFALFILCCGVTHVFSIYNLWFGAYGIHGIVKAITAIVSVITAVVLFVKLPLFLAIPSPQQLEQAMTEASNQKLKRNKLEIERKAEAIFKFATELLPTGLLVIDEKQQIIVANKALENIFGYQSDELKGQSIHCLLMDSFTSSHDALVNQYLKKPSQRYAMASGRVVRGKAKDGKEVFIEISLSAHEFEGEKHAFASVVDFNHMTSERNMKLEYSNRIQRAIDASNDGIWEWNIQNNNVWYSPHCMKLMGRNPDQELPHFSFWSNHIHPEDKERIEYELEQHFAGKTKYDVIYRGISESGEYEWMHSRGDTIFNDQGDPLLMSGTLSNIHNIKTLESELANKTRFLNQILERSLCAMYIFDLGERNNTFINQEYTKITGYTEQDLDQLQKNHGIMSMFHPDDHKNINEHFKEIFSDSKDRGASIQFRLKHKLGHWIWCYSRDSIYSLDSNDNPKEVLGTFLEITELKKQEEEIKNLAKDFLNTFEQAAMGIAHLSLNGSWLKVNQKLCDILGYKHKDLLDLSIHHVTHPEDINLDESQLKDLIDGNQNNYTIEKRFLKSDKEIIWINITASLVRDELGDPSYIIAVLEDISERKQVEQKLAESNASLERFAYSTSHDLQEPLRKISAFSDSVSRHLEGKIEDKSVLFELSRISDAASRMRQMINSLLELSRYSRQKMEKQTLLFSSLLNLVSEDLSEIIQESNAQIHLHEDFEINVDIDGFQQVLRNLISNSIRYKKPETPVIINIKKTRFDEKTRIEVADNGQGFDPKYAEQIFEPFRRLVGREIQGHGMGLALCRQIIQAHEGYISATSQPKIGSTFIIELPNKG